MHSPVECSDDTNILESSTEIRDTANSIRDWFEKTYGIRHFNDNFFENFLIRCDNDRQKCQKKLDNYVWNKKVYSEYLQAGDFEDAEFRNFCSSIFSVYLPSLSSTTGYCVYVDRITDDESLFDVCKIMKYYCMQTDLRFLENGYDSGDVILFDCNRLSLIKLATFVPYFVKTLVLLLEMYPLRLKLLVLINTGRTLDIFVNFLKFFLPKNIGNTIYAYADNGENFLKHVSIDSLPSDYNGTQPSLEEIREYWLKRLENRRNWFRQANESINSYRPDKSIYDIDYDAD